MTTGKLRQRWLTSEGQTRLQRVMRCLQRNLPLSEVPGLGRMSGRWDLRGAVLSSLKRESRIETEDHAVILRAGTMTLNRRTLRSIDFSCADISYSDWCECTVEDCLFEETVAREVRITAGHFTDCTFRGAHLRGSYMNRNKGTDSGSFRGVDFVASDLSGCIFCFPEIESCSFVNCRLIETDFDGSRFEDCAFKGDIESAWFGGYSVHAVTSFLRVFRRVNPKDFRNRMQNIDFSECCLKDVLFQNEIDLSSCRLPKGRNYIVVRNLPAVYNKMRETIVRQWSGEHRQTAMSWIDRALFGDHKKHMPMDIINRDSTPGHYPENLYARFFDLLERTNREVNAQS